MKVIAQEKPEVAAKLESTPLSTLWAYFKLTRLHLFPFGSNVVASPCLWGLIMAAYSTKDHSPARLLLQMMLWYLGGTLRHSAACVWDDICDRDIDGHVERSKNRPLVIGTVSLRGAFILFATLTSLYLSTLRILGVGRDTFTLSLFCVALLDTLYPLMKRWTFWPQAWLGFTLAWMIPVCWLSVTGGHYIGNSTVISALFLAYACYIIVFDTTYGRQDMKDDIQVGVKSTAILFGPNIREILLLFAGVLGGALTLAGIANGQGPLYFALCVAVPISYLAWKLWTVDFDDPQECLRATKSIGLLETVIWVGMFCDYLWMTCGY